MAAPEWLAVQTPEPAAFGHADPVQADGLAAYFQGADMGYGGSPGARRFGHKIAFQILGDPGGRTAFDDLPFETRPFYNGYPWFLPFVLRWHALVDRIGR